MILLAHLVIALSSIVVVTYAFFRPSQSVLRFSYVLIMSTLASGTYLVVSTHAAILGACTSGLFYMAAVSLGVLPARNKLARQIEK